MVQRSATIIKEESNANSRQILLSNAKLTVLMAYDPMQAIKGIELRLWTALVLNACIAILEIVMSAITGSTALLADGFHNADDVAALVLSLYTERQATDNPGIRRMLGFKRLNKLTGFAKGCIFLMSSVIVVFKIIQALIDPHPVDAQTVLIIGSIACIVNFTSALMLRGSQKRYDVKTAYNALVYDTLGSLIVIMGGALDLIFNLPYMFDIVSSVLLVGYMARTGWILVYKGRKLFLRESPPQLRLHRLRGKSPRNTRSNRHSGPTLLAPYPNGVSPNIPCVASRA
jgi:cobalt-zinc-cadmium efflux system protein